MDMPISHQQPKSRRGRVLRATPAGRYGRGISILLILPLLALFAIGFVYPIARLVAISFGETGLSIDQYRRVFETPLYTGVLMRTLAAAAVVTALSLVFGYPVALAMARAKGRTGLVIAAAVLIPLWTSVLVRSYAWIVLLQRSGLVNTVLLEAGFIATPLKLLYTDGAVILAMTHVLIPFMILPIANALRSLPADYGRAARSLGAGPISAFLRVTLPLSLPGVFAGSVMCFILAIGFYITPALVGGPEAMTMATLIAQQTTVVLDWPFAAALSTVLLTLTLLAVVIFRRALSISKGISSVA